MLLGKIRHMVEQTNFEQTKRWENKIPISSLFLFCQDFLPIFKLLKLEKHKIGLEYKNLALDIYIYIHTPITKQTKLKQK
jgi:hypothetical protein